MTETNKPVRVAAIADLHMKEDAAVSYRELFNEIAREADVLAIAGDLTDLGKPREAELLAEDLRGCGVPVVAVLGNHDHECDQVDHISHLLRDAGVHLLDGQTVELKGVHFTGVKGFAGGFGRRMLASFGEAAIKAMVAETVAEAMKLENALHQLDTERSVVLVHYAPIAETVKGEPLEIYPFLGSSRLGETIDRFRISAVVHGHAHHGTHEGRTAGGTRVYNVAYPIEKPTGRPYAVLEI
ncbi:MULTISPECIES: metallophosphoesterase family protein [Phyllobacteriaceae]|uniref:metallophosphoesterase family protein n=1 Tax=Phyllobacteriaceae TaxID=69277 RepID=UPI002ACA868C|nr:metallophosphoesterase [Chelativorans sp. M5D2P16]MDZ5699063.1 metallophosphoesterase [Chelativorans sp. M5D2P16]